MIRRKAVRAFLYMVTFAENQKLLVETPDKLTRNMVFDRNRAADILSGDRKDGVLPESDVRGLLEAYGFPVVLTEVAENEDQACRLSENIGFPVVLKLNDPDIVHKTDAGGVCLDLRSSAEVRSAYKQIIESGQRYKQNNRIEGVAIQPFFANPDYEILLGAKRDPDFGPVILFGMGGIFTEIMRDKALGLPPMNRLLARRLMQQTKTHMLLQGYRNRPPADLEQIEELIVRLSQFLVDFPEILELDMNPVLVKNGKLVVVDSRLLISKIDIVSPLHLVISPYPAENEYRMITEGDIAVFIRPIKPEDATLYLDFFRSLSPTSIYFRFFGVLKELPATMLSRFTQIDYDREIALVAIDEGSKGERILGVARIIGDPDGREGEFAVLVGDSWQGKGIGSSLLRKCLLIAEKRGFKRIYGTVLSENKNMLALGKKLGFAVNRGEDSGEYELQFNFGSPKLFKALEKL